MGVHVSMGLVYLMCGWCVPCVHVFSAVLTMFESVVCYFLGPC